MGQILHWGILQDQKPVGVETCGRNEFVEVGFFFFFKVTEVGLVRRSWVQGS